MTRAGEETPVPASSAAAALTLRGAGSTFVFPLMRRWVEAHPDASRTAVTYRSVGSGAGVAGILAGELDFGATDSALSDAELAAAPARILHIPIALGAVTVAYNPDGVPHRLNLAAGTVAGIFLGEIGNWNDPRIAATNPGIALPDLPITVAFRADASGTTDVFTRYLAHASDAWRGSVGAARLVKFPVGLPARGNDGVAAIVKLTPGAIGYVELATTKLAGLGYAAVENAAGQFVEPTIASVSEAAASASDDGPADRAAIVNPAGRDAYPIASFTFALIYERGRGAREAAALARFLWWAVHDGQRLGEPLFYAPLPRAVVARAERLLRALPGTPPTFESN